MPDTDVVVVIPWPRYPTVTPGGKESQSKRAGKMVPWPSANVVNNLPHPLYRQVVTRWREAAFDAASPVSKENAGWPATRRNLVMAQLFTATNHRLDAFAVLEGCKPVIDGLVLAGLLEDDTEEYVAGGLAWSRKAETRADCHLVIRLRPL